MIKNLEQALEYYKLGFSLIPFIPKAKRELVIWEHPQTIRTLVI